MALIGYYNDLGRQVIAEVNGLNYSTQEVNNIFEINSVFRVDLFEVLEPEPGVFERGPYITNLVYERAGEAMTVDGSNNPLIIKREGNTENSFKDSETWLTNNISTFSAFTPTNL